METVVNLLLANYLITQRQKHNLLKFKVNYKTVNWTLCEGN